MAGRFEGLSDLEWHLLADIFPPALLKRGHGMPHTPFHKVVNTLLCMLITGCRWCYLPRGPQRASKSAAPGACRGARDDPVAVRGHRQLLLHLAKAAVRASPTAGRARESCSIVSPRQGACR
jgi:hypothetical protein